MHFFEFSIGEYSKCGYLISDVSLDLHNSDFALQTEFPILMNQLFGKMLNSYLLTEAVITAGENYEVNQVSFVKENAGLYQVEGEMAEGKVTLKNMQTGEQQQLTPDELVAAVAL